MKEIFILFMMEIQQDIPNTTANFLYLDTDRTTGLPFDTQTGQCSSELTANCG